MYSKPSGARIALAVPLWLFGNLAFGQTIVDTLTAEERTVGNVMYTPDRIASLEGSMPVVYEAFLTDQWRSRNGFEKYDVVVSQLREYWDTKELVGSARLLHRVYDTFTDEQRTVLEPVFEQASVTLLQTHLASEHGKDAIEEPFEEIRTVLATASQSEAKSFASCLRDTRTTQHGCFEGTQIAFDNAIEECIGKFSPSESADLTLGPCTLFEHHLMSDRLSSCLIDFSTDNRRCLSEIDWPATPDADH